MNAMADALMAAAQRQRRAVTSRSEGPATRMLEALGGIPMNMAGTVKNLMDAAYTHPMGTSVADNPQYSGLAAETAMNVVGLPALTGGVPAGALGSAAKGIRAYHGSPHDFDRFDLSKIGTGEGAQAYGHGLYFAENEGVARAYRDNLASGYRINGEPYAGFTTGSSQGTPGNHAANALSRFSGDRDAAIKWLKDGGPTDVEAAKLLRKAKVEPWDGRMYEVNINAHPDQFLDWDRPLSQQSENVRKAMGVARDVKVVDSEIEAINSAINGRVKPATNDFDALFANPDTELGGMILRRNELRREADQLRSTYADLTGEQIMRGETTLGRASDPLKREDLLARGIPGIKYLDRGSRSAGEGSRNYVVFDDKLIDILKKYGLMAGALGGTGALAPGEQVQ